jgi:phospholipid/cholesterol/gamma-HCH transport system permease protein
MRRKGSHKRDREAARNTSAKFVGIKREQNKTSLVLEGEWTVRNAGPIEQAIEDAQDELGRGSFSEVIATGIEKLDTSGAMLLKKLLSEKQLPRNLTESQRALLEFLPAFSEYNPPEKKQPSAIVRFFSGIGESVFVGLHFLREIFEFIGRVSARLVRNILHPRHFRVPSIARHVQETGVQALPIIGLLAVLISMVITYQGSIQLRKFGADIYTIDLTVISLLREMGVLMTAIMVAGRSGSAFTAEIGVMNLREEVNALKTMGLDPIEVLVLPRLLALLITLPLLTFLADVIGLAGNGIMSFFLLNASPQKYLARVQDVADLRMFFVGMIKAPVFAFLIAVIGCYQGLKVTSSAESVGRKTTLSVVQAIFFVIMADALFSIIFSSLGV